MYKKVFADNTSVVAYQLSFSAINIRDAENASVLHSPLLCMLIRSVERGFVQVHHFRNKFKHGRSDKLKTLILRNTKHHFPTMMLIYELGSTKLICK